MNDQKSPNPNAVSSKNPYTAWFVVASFVAPVALAYIMFYFVDVTSFTNRGEIFNPVIAVETLGLKDESGAVIPKNKLTYKWRIYSFVGENCNDACNKRLTEVRQMHKTLGKDAHRLIRVIVHLEKPGAALLKTIKKEYPNVLTMFGDEKFITAAIKNNANIRENEIYFMDPHGNIMMRFTQDQPIKEVRYDLRKLLKASQIG